MPSYTKVISPNGGEIEIISIAISEGKNTYRVTLTTEDNKNLGYIIYTIDNAHVYLHDLRKTTTENYLNVEVALLERMQVKSFVYSKGQIETYFMSPLLFSLGLRYKPKYEWQFAHGRIAHGRKQNLQTLGSNYKTAKSENEKNNLKQSILKLLKELSIQEAVKTQVRENLGLSDTADITVDQMVEHGLFFNLNQLLAIEMEKAKKQVETSNLSDLIQNLETYIPEDEIAKRKLALGISEEFIVNTLKSDLANQQEMIEDLEVKNRQLKETNAKQTKDIEREVKTLEVANKQFTFLEEASYEITKITDTEFRNTLTKYVPKLIRMGMFTNEHLLILKNLPRMISDLEKGATQPRIYLDKFLEESKKRDSFLSSEKEYRIAAKSHFANNIATLSQQVVSKFINAIKNLLITEKAFTVSRVNAHFLAKFSELQMHLKDEVKKLEKSPHHKPYCTYLLRYIRELESIQGAGCIDTQEDKITFTQDIKPVTEEMLENFLKTDVLIKQVITKSLN